MRAIIGPNGAGKTTMMDIITGKTRPDEGDGDVRRPVDLTKLDEAAIANLGIGRKFQKPTVFDFHTIEDNILLALKSKRTVAGRCSGATAPRRERIDDILGIIKLGDRDRLAGSLSHGQKQWLEIGMLLAQDPKLLLVDEPVAGMTDGETADRRAAQGDREGPFGHRGRARHGLRARTRRQGHLLHEGSVLAEGTLDQVSANERVVEVYLGREHIWDDRWMMTC
jgi:urea transport system ATP-binding protein